MNLDYLGDALDHWKGSLFEYLRAENLLRDFAVDPMATDRERWNEADFSLFARLLRIGRHQIIPHEASLLARAQYFGEIVHGGDVFLDPDTGIAGYKLVVVPADYVMNSDSADAIRNYVRNGGTAMMTAMSAKVDETNQWFDTPMPGRLGDVFGIRTEEFNRPNAPPEMSVNGQN